MAYELNKTDGTLLVILSDGLIDNFTTSLKFIGKNVFNYGEIQNENFLQLLENFSDSTPPQNPLNGQLWFDAATNSLRLKVFDGFGWKHLPYIHVGATQITNQTGDFWFDTENQLLYLNTGTGFSLVGDNLDANAANKLKNGRTINGVTFDGTQNITVTANTAFPLSAGLYVDGETFDGSAPKTWNVDVGNVENADAGKVVARNSVGDIWFRIGNGQATSSKYADLAEKYLADCNYAIGTVVSIGGTSEITACNKGDRPLGAISKNPGYMMNSDLQNGVYVALKGRVPVKISGTVKKGDKLVAGPNGTAETGSVDYFAISLQDSNGNDFVEAVIL